MCNAVQIGSRARLIGLRWAAVIALLATTSLASAQHARVYVANSSNSRILLVQFDPPSTTVVNDDANQLTQVRDIELRDDGLVGLNLLVADRNGGQVVFYQNASSTGQVVFDTHLANGPARPDGLSVDLAGNLFVTNSGQGSSGGANEVWAVKRDAGCPDPLRAECLNGGYRTPLGLIDGQVQIATQIGGGPAVLVATDLPESLVCTSTGGAFQAGDLLVLANPAALVRYPAADVAAFLDALSQGHTPAQLTPQTVIHPPESSVPAAQRFPSGTVPNGMALAPNGDLLITVSDGRILIYGRDGNRRPNGFGGFIDFASGDGQDELKIAVGLQDGRNRAFVTHQQRGQLRRYNFAADGTGTPDAFINDFQSPVGVVATTSNTVPAPAGSNVDVAPTTILESRIEQVVHSGAVNARVGTFADPREDEQVTPDHQPLHRSLFLNELRADLPPIEIPDYVRAFRLGDPDFGVPTFILVEADSSAGFAGLVDHHGIESIILGYEPNCLDADATRQPYLFWSPDANDPPIVEGAVFIDVTSGCGSIRGLTRDLSYFLVGVRVTAPLDNVVADKLSGLRQVIVGQSCIEARLRRKLENLMDRADREFSRNRYMALADALSQIDLEVERSPLSFVRCTINISGEIQARTRSALFALSKLQ